MINLSCAKKDLDPVEYPESSDEAWKEFGGFKNKMINWTGCECGNQNFNNRLYNLIAKKPLRILELGCGTGQFIENCLNDGHIAIGLDGNKYYKELKLHSWGRVSDYLFTCDIGKDFTLYENENVVLFDIITTWELLEHLYEPDLDQVLQNIDKHSTKGTYFIFSASQRHHPPGHQCLHNKEWWVDKFKMIGFREVDLNFGNDVLRNFGDSIFGYMVKE